MWNLVFSESETDSWYVDLIGKKILKKGDFKITELLTKTLFSLYFRDCPKNGERNKEDFESICARVTKYTSKYVAKAEFNLN